MWPESSSVNAVNLLKKICYNSRDIEFFLRDYFFGAPCRPKSHTVNEHSTIGHPGNHKKRMVSSTFNVWNLS